MLQLVLQLMLRQAETDARCEEAKGLLPPGCQLDAVFESLDRFHKGSVTETDVWQFCQEFGAGASYASLAALFYEVQLRRPEDKSGLPGRLSLREVGILVLPLGSKEYDTVLQAGSDVDARKMLNLLRDYRSHDTSMISPPEPLHGVARYQLFRLLDVSARAAEDLSRFRSQLAVTPGYDFSSLNELFQRMAYGKHSINKADLRNAFFKKSMPISEHQLGLLWHRYLPYGGAELPFADFARQLKPSAARLD